MLLSHPRRKLSSTRFNSSSNATLTGAGLTRQNKKSDLRGLRDAVKDEANLSSVQLQAVKAQVFTVFRKIEKRYKLAIKRAARRIVKEGRAEQFLDKKLESSDSSLGSSRQQQKRQVIEVQEYISGPSCGRTEGFSGMAQYNGGAGFADGERSEATDVQTIMLQQETNDVLQHLKHRNLVNEQVVGASNRLTSSKKAAQRDGYSSTFSLKNNNPSLLNRLGSGRGQSTGQSQLSEMQRGVNYNSMDMTRKDIKGASQLANHLANQKEGKDVLLSQPAILVNDGDDINVKKQRRLKSARNSNK